MLSFVQSSVFLPLQVATVGCRLTAINPDKAPARWPPRQPDTKTSEQIRKTEARNNSCLCIRHSVVLSWLSQEKIAVFWSSFLPLLHSLRANTTPLHTSTPPPRTLLYRLPLKGFNEGDLVSPGRECAQWLTCLWCRFGGFELMSCWQTHADMNAGPLFLKCCNICTPWFYLGPVEFWNKKMWSSEHKHFNVFLSWDHNANK